MRPDDAVAMVEAAAFAAWPAAEEHVSEGWIMRFGDGFSRRLNSVTVLPGAEIDDVVGRAAAAIGWLTARGVDPVARVLSATDPSVDRAFAAAGFTREGETVVMTGPNPRGGARTAHAGEPVPEWLTVLRDWLGIGDHQATGWRQVLARIAPPVSYATTTDDSSAAAAVGIGIVRDDWLSIFEVATDPARRRRGHATALVRGLGDWAALHGAERALLQVVADNHPARALWSTLGFTESYRYWYRRPPPRNRE